MIGLLTLSILFRRGPGSEVSVRDALAAALVVVRSESSGASWGRPKGWVRLASWSGAFSKAHLRLLRAGLDLGDERPAPRFKTLTIDIGPVRRLPNGRLTEDVAFVSGPRGGFEAHYVVDPDRGPLGVVERRKILAVF